MGMSNSETFGYSIDLDELEKFIQISRQFNLTSVTWNSFKGSSDPRETVELTLTAREPS